MRTIDKSLEWYERAKKAIPGAAQCLSKQYGRFIQGVSPPVIDYGVMSSVYDYDGNEYLDWTASLGPIVLGYNYFNIFCDHIVLPMTNHLEVELAEKLIDIIPSAEMVRFFKGGADACSAAVRLSRAIVRKPIIVTSGYHGWHDWFTCTLSYPRAEGTLNSNTIDIEYGDLERLESLFEDGRVSCFILEPMTRKYPERASTEYLKEVRKLCDKYGVILIFDEVIMGFRYAMAGGEEYFGVTPDLSCYAKAIANGYPLATLTGKRELMEQIEPLQITGTYFSELLSIKAALKTIDIIEKENVIKYLYDVGEGLGCGIRDLIDKYELRDRVNLKGFGPWSSLVWAKKADFEHNYFLQEMAKRGILYNRDFFSMRSHCEEDVDMTLEAIDRIFDEIRIRESLFLEGKPIDGSLFPV